MMILHICDLPDVLSVFRILNIVITIIKIVVPIILIVSLSINYLNAVKSNDYDALAKANKQLVPKIIAVVLIFYIPIFVDIIAGISYFDDGNYKKCLDNANKEYISSLIDTEARMALNVVKESSSSSDYYDALAKINKIKDAELRSSMMKELEALKPNIKNNSGGTPGTNNNNNNINIDISPGSSGSIYNSLGIIYYNQCDKRWGNIEYDIGGGTSENGHATVCSSGCGYTSFAMIAASLNNNFSINPYDVIKSMRNIKDGELTQRGYGSASWNEICGSSIVSSKYNLKCEYIKKNKIMDALNEGKPVIINVPQHYMVLSLNSSGKIVLIDPNTRWADSRKKSGEYNSISEIEDIYGAISVAGAYTKI